MATLTLKNIPDELYDPLRRSAAEAQRSLDSKVPFRLEASLDGRKLDAEELLMRARVARRSVGHQVTESELQRACSAGRS
ncbi:MAG: DNA-binding protein [Acidobacteriota bacterium]|nr:DNA-binding protein [Acidobacteriota bacterium]